MAKIIIPLPDEDPDDHRPKRPIPPVRQDQPIMTPSKEAQALLLRLLLDDEIPF